MDQTPEKIVELLRRYTDGVASSSEKEELTDWAADHQDNGAFQQHVQTLFDTYVLDDNKTRPDWERIYENILAARSQNVHLVHRIHVWRTAWFKYAAAILVIILISLVYRPNIIETPGISKAEAPVNMKNDVLPGSDKAILTLSNGKIIELNATEQKNIKDGDLTIQNQNGSLTYGKSEVVVYNTMSTPNGGQYQLTLPDGTKVWLNAASSIRYPTAFPSKTREVEIIGEAYFEVTKNPTKPFIVKTNKDVITVLGTHFNVNAYSDNRYIKTSLLEGAVQVDGRILKPGHAYINGKILQINLEQEVAWKNGVFNFNQLSLREAMQQLSRWYDVEIVYKDEIVDFNFYGEVQRSLTLSQVIKILSGMGIRLTIEQGKRLVVSKD